MYHYVRDLAHSKYPEIKGLDIHLFVEQIEYLSKHYHFITIEQLIESSLNRVSLPKNAVVLTFDDGYIDHFQYVFPILKSKKIQGSFYIPVLTVTENQILDVNKIHFILASVYNKSNLILDIYFWLDHFREEYKLFDNEYYYNKLAHSSRFDSAEVIFIKRLLQVELDEKLRNIIVNELFKKYVSSDEKSFSRELYLSKEQIEEMNDGGMHIGGHGNSHYWLGSLSKEKQVIEIERSIEFIGNIGGDLNNWTMCYPYGNYNDDTIDILKDSGCKLAWTTQVDIYNTAEHHCLTAPRLDTNDLPKDRNASTNHWFDKL